MNNQAEDLIYNHVVKELAADGFKRVNAEDAGDKAVDLYHKNMMHEDAITTAISLCKQTHKRVER